MELGQALSQVRGDSGFLKCAACSLHDGSVVGEVVVNIQNRAMGAGQGRGEGEGKESLGGVKDKTVLQQGQQALSR